MKSCKFVAGADPGKHGAVFLLPIDSALWKGGCECFPFQKNKDGDMDPVSLYQWLSGFSDNIVAVYKENVHAIVGNSAKSMFSFGESNGILKAVLRLVSDKSSEGFQTVEVSPAKWQKTAWRDVDIVKGQAMVDRNTGLIKRNKAGEMMFKSDPKATSLNAARRIFDGMDVQFVPKGCKKEHDGIVDAALIAYHGFVELTA